MSNNKQSSVEFFLYEMFSLLGEFENKALPSYKIMDLFEQAKAMHKTEIGKVAEDWWNEGAGYMYDGQREYNSFEQYYNETFGGNND